MLTSGPLARDRWQDLIPHAGNMCLLDSVEHWDDHSILCRTRSHADPANPLRREGRLSALHLAEYGAQAMAIHGGLLATRANRRAPPGYLASLRDVRLGVSHVEHIKGELEVQAEVMTQSENGWIYQFRVSTGGEELASGRVTVIHQAGQA
jgi:predicted hotdog family 3-hydroxylacyl-ACP dehydratase